MVTAVESLPAFVEFVRTAPLGVIATVDPSGAPEAALVSFAATPSGDLLFDTRTGARKLVNLLAEPRVAVVLGGTGAVSVQVEGTATVESDVAREAAARVYEARFPGSHALADGFALVRVRPHWLRHYDAGADPAVVVAGRPAWRDPAG